MKDNLLIWWPITSLNKGILFCFLVAHKTIWQITGLSEPGFFKFCIVKLILAMLDCMFLLKEFSSFFFKSLSPFSYISPNVDRVNTVLRSSINDWKTTPWKSINVEQMDMDCKKFAKDIRSLDKEMRAWDAYLGVESTVKNMLTSLRAVSELQNPAIRDRHWQQLMAATKVRFCWLVA